MAQSTDGGRGKIGFRHGRHAWEVIWEGPLGNLSNDIKWECNSSLFKNFRPKMIFYIASKFYL